MQSHVSTRLYKTETIQVEAASPTRVTEALRSHGVTQVIALADRLPQDVWARILDCIGWQDAALPNPTRQAWQNIALLNRNGNKLFDKLIASVNLPLNHIMNAAEPYIKAEYKPNIHPGTEAWFMRILCTATGWDFSRDFPEPMLCLDGGDEEEFWEQERTYLYDMPGHFWYKNTEYPLRLHRARRTGRLNENAIADWDRLWAVFSDGRKTMFRTNLWKIIDAVGDRAS